MKEKTQLLKMATEAEVGVGPEEPGSPSFLPSKLSPLAKLSRKPGGIEPDQCSL